MRIQQAKQGREEAESSERIEAVMCLFQRLLMIR